METTNEDSAEVLEAAINQAWQLLLTNMTAEAVDPASPPEVIELVRRTSQLLTPNRKGTSLRVSLDSNDTDVKQLVADVMLPAVQSARENARRCSG